MTVEPLQRCEHCQALCAPGMACVSNQPGHTNAEQPCRAGGGAALGLVDLALVLAEHTTRGVPRQIHPPDGPNCGWAVVRVCACGDWSAPATHDDSDKDAHRQHVAAALLASIEKARA